MYVYTQYYNCTFSSLEPSSFAPTPLHAVSPPWEGNHPLPRTEAMLRWILLSHLQQDLDVWQLVGQCWPVVSRLWDEHLSPQAEAIGEARWTGLLWYEERAPSGTLPKVPGAWHLLQESQTAVVEAADWLQDRVNLVLHSKEEYSHIYNFTNFTGITDSMLL